ncbi:hypothetical protein [Sphingobium algorifonticola]|uniref:AcrB/AcrD/AcrF family protein n=1 Tax=Sphingobium algorifonticola TaxID=2008318 RepID=A0A437JD26_9SPHN|nr:hypothetical protein [Sphingobium algorifonticola]RVT43653.1 hypothetical protein ENE74_03330 [Sphingobium algorifonticola]
MPALPPPSRWRLAPSVAILALLLCLLMTTLGWTTIQTLAFRDPDDAMRYVQVRDFLAGQGWFDVSQHRVNPPVGGPMHWSRLVDLPIAGVMLVLRPLLGAATADRVALVLVPLLLLGMLFGMLALAVRRLAGTLPAIMAAVLLVLSMPVLIQFQPTRIDHHGWQILMAATALWAIFDPQARRGGIIAGLAVALWTHVSSEGLPYAALFGGVLALAYLRDARAWPRLLAFALALTGGAAALLLLARGWPDGARIYCDAISPVYLLPMIAASVALPVARRLLGEGHWLRRGSIAALAGVVGATVYLAVGGECRGGPFQTLDPVVYKYWYLNVAEGRPVWEQSPLMAAIVIVPPLFGMIGCFLAARNAEEADRRFAWIIMLLIAGGAYGVSLFVMRALSIANLMALPGLAMLMLLLLPKAQALRTAWGRVLATAALCGLTPIGISALAASLLPGEPADSATGQAGDNCTGQAQLQHLAALPRGTIMAPMDISPYLLAFTPHAVVATPHHRNEAGMRAVIRTFMGGADDARAILMRHRIAYLAYCPGRAEIDSYARHNPAGFMQLLLTGPVPTWLERVPTAPGDSIRLYRVRR